jgi:hypothetical protein
MGANNTNLHEARLAKNDEFYTLLRDIEAEMSRYLEHDPDLFRGKVVLCPCDDPGWSNFTKFFVDNFEVLGLSRLVSSCYRAGARGFFLDMTSAGSEEGFLQGDGDFRSPEVTALRDSADFVITNPPFSLFREFAQWLRAGDVRFSVVGGANAITYKDVFPQLQAGRWWLGAESPSSFIVGGDGPQRGAQFGRGDRLFQKFGNIYWYTNLEYSSRAEPLDLMTWEENVRFSRRAQVRGVGYDTYADYDAIEVPYADAIPADYSGVMGVPISFLRRHRPEQFEIVGVLKGGRLSRGGRAPFARLLIRFRQGGAAGV